MSTAKQAARAFGGVWPGKPGSDLIFYVEQPVTRAEFEAAAAAHRKRRFKLERFTTPARDDAGTIILLVLVAILLLLLILI